MIPQRSVVLRAAGAAVGVFIVSNLAGEALRPRFDVLGDWVTLPATPWIRHALCAAVAVALLAGVSRRERPPAIRRAEVLLLGAVAAFALLDAAGFYAVLLRGSIHTPAVLPASLLVAAFFAALARDRWTNGRAGAPPPARLGLAGALVAGGVLLALPVIRMITFGPTRYERPADCAVVFGARVWNDGTPSNALADRVDEAIALYQRGLVKRLLMSGGIDPGNGFSEAAVMRARAEAAGVPAEAILVDEAGVDTVSTVRNASALMREAGLGSALVVSHYYHEPRAKMLFDRAGVRAYTVPAHMRRRLLKEPWFVAREALAYWRSFAIQ